MLRLTHCPVFCHSRVKKIIVIIILIKKEILMITTNMEWAGVITSVGCSWVFTRKVARLHYAYIYVYVYIRLVCKFRYSIFILCSMLSAK